MKFRRLLDASLSLTFTLTLLASCRGTLDDSEDGGRTCVVGHTAPCTCPDTRQSTATCLSTGSYGACQCSSANVPQGLGGSTNQPLGSGGRSETTSYGSGGFSLTPTGGTTSSGGVSPTGGATSRGGSASSAGATAVNDLPCPVRDIVAKSCATCHGATPMFGAPMSLTRAADFRTRGSTVLARTADNVHPMPPEPYARLTKDESAALKSFIDAGAPASSCTTPVPDPPTGTDPEPTTNDPSVTCYKITARDSKTATTFSVPTTPDLYQCFQYALPWGSKKVHVVSAKPITDNAKVLHHWILYNNTGSVTDGASVGCVGAHPDATMVAGWAPGGQPMTLPDDVGLEPSAGGLTLETHYNNSTGSTAKDGSGVEVCVTEKLRPNVAAIHWLGTQSLNKVNATGTCTPTNTKDVTILSATPHMHLQGRNLKTVINRKGGGTETLLDKAFDFNTQVSYRVSAVVHPGDTLTTTCTYAQPTPFGEGTNQEMCYNFVLAYPAGGLAQALQLLRKNDCSGF